MTRLRRSDSSTPGITRRGRGRGFEYRDPDGGHITAAAELGRIRSLAIPPAWREVWICPDPAGHLQATGVDAAGRKQYLYHPAWREHRDRRKFQAMLEFAAVLPRVRRVIAEDLGREGCGRERVLACAVRLLDQGLFRIGGEHYAEEHDSYGLATLLRHHVRVKDGGLVFDYAAKGGARRVQAIEDDDVNAVIRRLERRRSGPDELLVYRDRGGWHALRSGEINAYLRAVADHDCSAKDFRTWNATVLAAVWLATVADGRSSQTARQRAIRQATSEVAHQLGDTPAVTRRSYIDPRVFDAFRAGCTIDRRVAARDGQLRDGRGRRRLERAVIDLLS